MIKQIINLPISDNEIPDKVEYVCYDENDLIVSTGWSNVTSITKTARGHQLTLLLDFDTTLSNPGIYTIQLIATVKGQTHTTEFKHEVENTSHSNTDIITLTREVQFPSNYVMYNGNLPVARGSTITIPDSINPKLDPIYAMSTDQNTYDDIRVWFVTPSIMLATKDLRSYLDRLHRQVRLDSLEHTDEDYLLWLQAGKDRLNLLLTTTFDMTDATGPIRDLWLVASQIQCLRTRYLEEGLTSFNYGGAAVTLDIDVTQYLEQLASTLESRLDNDSIKLRMQLHQRNLTSGTGRYMQGSGVAGALGITTGLTTSY